MSDFWARRRAAVAEEEAAERVLVENEARAEREAVQSEKSDEELLQELGLPDPDTLTDESEFKAFLAEAVPGRLKTRALRRLWRMNPVLANLDGLIEYGEDYTDAATVVENLQTAYQVGKGMLSHLEEMARKAAAEEAEEPEAEIEAETAEVLVEAEEIEAEDIAPVELPAFAEQLAEVVPLARQRRMTFTFEDQRTG